MPFAFPPFFISIHALREEGDTAFPKWVRIFCNFYPRPPRGGRRSVCLDFFCKPNISIHALREEGDASPYPVIHVFIVFLSTPSARRATCSDPYHHGYLAISIHALREEGDLKGWSPLSNLPLFLSTPSARRATELALLKTALTGNFYPRPPRGGRRAFVPVGDVGCSISIHALREEGDSVYFQTVPSSSTFLSTPSARRATRPEWCEKILSGISIHALREEGDRSSSCTTHRPSDFYPRPPRGGRRYGYGKHKVWVIFLSTPSARRATAVSPSNTYKLTFLSTPSARRATTILARSMQRGEFLSTPSARRATVRSVLSQSSRMDFYPRPPRGGRLPEIINEEEQLDISIHALREEGDESPRNERHLTGDFYPRPPRGGRPYRWQGSHLYYHDFYPRPPRGGRLSEAGTEGLTVAFLSTPSARRATDIAMYHSGVRKISIHALREEGDG